MLLIWASLLLNKVCAWFSSLSSPKLVEIKLIDPAELIFEERLVTSSVILLPPFFLLPQKSSLRFLWVLGLLC